MTVGSRISALRKKNNFSQEYVAEKLEVSRQAVSKWERDLSIPDTSNIIKLADLLGSSVEYIASGKIRDHSEEIRSEKEEIHTHVSKKMKIIIAILSVLTVISLCVLCFIVFIKIKPVDWDAGSCSGGYATYIFDKYEEDLVQKFIKGCENKNEISNVAAIRGTQEATWEDRMIFLEFDIEYQHRTEGTVRQRIHFTGKRKWIDTYSWSGAIIEG